MVDRSDLPSDWKKRRWDWAVKACKEANMPYPPMSAELNDCGYNFSDVWDLNGGNPGAMRWRVDCAGNLMALIVYGMVTRKVRRKVETFLAPVGGKEREDAIFDLRQKQATAGKSAGT